MPKPITISRHTCFGKARLSGTGVTVESLVSRFRAGESVDSVAEGMKLTRQQVEAAMWYQLSTPYHRRAMTEIDWPLEGEDGLRAWAAKGDRGAKEALRILGVKV